MFIFILIYLFIYLFILLFIFMHVAVEPGAAAGPAGTRVASNGSIPNTPASGHATKPLPATPQVPLDRGLMVVWWVLRLC